MLESRCQSFDLCSMSDIRFNISHTKSDDRNNNDNESHIHEEYEIYLNISGNVAFEVENKIYPISRGSVIITKPHEYHHCIISEQTVHEFYWITFFAQGKEDYLKIFFERKKGENNLIILDEDGLAKMTDIFESLLCPEPDELEKRILFLQMFKVLRSGESVENIKEAALPEDIRKVLSYMDGHIAEEIDAAALCRVANFSINTLERHFISCLGTTPFAVLRKKRLVLSTHYLRQGESVSNAATKSGFSDYSNYIQIFKKHFGMTPLEYKKKFAHKT